VVQAMKRLSVKVCDLLEPWLL